MDEWQDISTAPEGEPTEDVGSRSSSEGFRARRKDGVTVIGRRASTYVGHDWEDTDRTFYLDGWFTHWMPHPTPPEEPG